MCHTRSYGRRKQRQGKVPYKWLYDTLTINTTNISNLNQSDVTTYILVGHSARGRMNRGPHLAHIHTIYTGFI